MEAAECELWWLYTSMEIMKVVVDIPVQRDLPGREAGPVQNLIVTMFDGYICQWRL